MLATGVRVGESLAAVWSEVDLDAGTMRITSTQVRVKGEDLPKHEEPNRGADLTAADEGGRDASAPPYDRR